MSNDYAAPWDYQWTRADVTAYLAAERDMDADPVPVPDTTHQQPCHDGDHYGQCRDVTAPYFPAPEPEADEIEIDKIPIPPYAGYIGADGHIVPPEPEAGS